MPFRDDYEAALERVAALEAELARARDELGRDHGRIAELEGDLRTARVAVPEAPKAKPRAEEPTDEGAPSAPLSKRAARRADQMVRGITGGVILALMFFVGGLPRIIKSRAAARGYDWNEKLALATAEARSHASDAQIETAYAKYVDPDGHIVIADWSIKRRSSGVRFDFRSVSGAKPAPQGMLGAPTSSRASECKVISLEYTPDAGWLTGDGDRVSESDDSGAGCARSTDAPPRCTLAQVWKHAIALGAPHPALASIELRTGRDNFPTIHGWRFEVVDTAGGGRGFVKVLPDDC